MSAEKLLRALLEADRDMKDTWRTEIFISPGDARDLYYVGPGRFKAEATFEVGQVATLLGKRAVISDLPKGVAYVGRRVDVNPKPCPTCGQEVQ